MAQNGDQSDVEAIPTELSVKHPLQNAWVLWFDNPVKRLGEKDWKNNLKKVCPLFTLL
jgi:translation initiation factor 4E